MTRWRIGVHALDRTGPPVLARTVLRWLRRHHPAIDLDVVAFRGGDLLGDFIDLAPTFVLLEPGEPWDHREPPCTRFAEIQNGLRALEPADLTLLVSVSAAQILPHVAETSGEVVAWVVEQGEDLHWLDGPLNVRYSVHRWLAGSIGTQECLRDRGIANAAVVPEFVDADLPDPTIVDHCRRAFGCGPEDLLIVGAGIATPRKAPDLFLETALTFARRGSSAARWVWIGGEHDVMFHTVRQEAERLEIDVRLMPSVPDIVPWLAAADVFVHPARLDAFPLVCLHAAIAKTPVVGFTNAGGLGEMFGPSVQGVPYPDIAGLADQILKLSRPAERDHVVNAQHAYVSERFVADVCAPALVSHLSAELRGIGR